MHDAAQRGPASECVLTTVTYLMRCSPNQTCLTLLRHALLLQDVTRRSVLLRMLLLIFFLIFVHHLFYIGHLPPLF